MWYTNFLSFDFGSAYHLVDISWQTGSRNMFILCSPTYMMVMHNELWYMVNQKTIFSLKYSFFLFIYKQICSQEQKLFFKYWLTQYCYPFILHFSGSSWGWVDFVSVFSQGKVGYRSMRFLFRTSIVGGR